MSEQKLVKVGDKHRRQIELAVSANRRASAIWKEKRARELGPGACTHCGAEPCGAYWTRPGDTEPGGERCCERCDHPPVEGWLHTHTAFGLGQAFPVCALRMKEGEVVYLRRDGTVQFLELHTPAPGSALGGQLDAEVPSVVFQGRDQRHLALFFAGEGGPEHANLWEHRREVDPLWLAVRLQAATARDEARKVALLAEAVERDAELDRLHAQAEAERAAKLAADLEVRAIKHETVTVLREMEGLEEEPVEMPEASAPAEADADASTEDAVPEKLSRAELKLPAAPRPTGGRLKRSKRQRMGIERKKRVLAMREAKARLEVKRLERLARAEKPVVVKGES